MEKILPTKFNVAYFSEEKGIQIIKGFDVNRKDEVCGLVIDKKPLPVIWSVAAVSCLRANVVPLMESYLHKGIQVSLPSRAECQALCSVVCAPDFNKTLELLAQHGVNVSMVEPDKLDNCFCRDSEHPRVTGICRFIIRG